MALRPGEPNRRANIWTARIVPALLLGIIGYSSWVVTKLVCTDYILKSSPSLTLHRNVAAAVVILTIYYILMFMMLSCYIRLIQTIVSNPGYVPRGPQWYSEKRQKLHQKEDNDSVQKDDVYQRRSYENILDSGYRVDDFWCKDVFVCGYDGRPNFCSICYNWKPDRAHHCKEVERCVLKMDHFCPWVGGIVSETSFKYFIQFTFWGALYCFHTLIFMAYYFAQRQRHETSINVHWLLALIFAALFGLFGAGMCGSSLQFAFVNSTTIENLTRQTKIWYLAVYIPEDILRKIHISERNDLRMITYPRPPSEHIQILQQSGATLSQDQQMIAASSPSYDNPQTSNPRTNTNPTKPFPTHPAINPNRTSNTSSTAPTDTQEPSINSRTFAILETRPGANPFDIGTRNNFEEVMGHTVFDWLLPLRPSPLTQHDNPESLYRVGRVVYKLRKEAGILGEHDRKRRSSRRRRRRNSSHGNDVPNDQDVQTE